MSAAAPWLRRLIAQYTQGKGHFPEAMGLAPDAFSSLARQLGIPPVMLTSQVMARHSLHTALLQPRLHERDQLAVWLKTWLTADGAPLHQIIASASMGFNHLWEDLGLDSRAELGLLMQDCFPALVAMNDKKMRWKKFFYRQRCLQQEGDLVCRSPSCDVCCEWIYCFAPEDPPG